MIDTVIAKKTDDCNCCGPCCKVGVFSQCVEIGAGVYNECTPCDITASASPADLNGVTQVTGNVGPVLEYDCGTEVTITVPFNQDCQGTSHTLTTLVAILTCNGEIRQEWESTSNAITFTLPAEGTCPNCEVAVTGWYYDQVGGNQCGLEYYAPEEPWSITFTPPPTFTEVLIPGDPPFLRSRWFEGTFVTLTAYNTNPAIPSEFCCSHLTAPGDPITWQRGVTQYAFSFDPPCDLSANQYLYGSCVGDCDAPGTGCYEATPC